MKVKIAENIRTLRKEHALTQEQLAEALGVTVGAVYKWEAGLSTPEVRLIMELADMFEVSVDVLLGYEQQSGKPDACIERIEQSINEMNYEEAVSGIIAQLGVFIVGAYLALSGKAVTPGVVLVFVNLMNYILQPISVLPEILANRKAALALIDKLCQALNENVRKEKLSISDKLHDAIELKQLSFGYKEGEEVLQNINLRFQAGKSYALVGASGSGKSTILNLLLAGYDNYSGSISYDGQELRNIDSESLYDIVSVVQQNVVIFNASVRENITMFREVPKEEVDKVIAMSGLLPFIREHGEEYLCGENGNALSGGEKQRISIARSLLRRSSVLLVDEATAALDKQTAHQVSNSILDIDGVTKIVVTHSLEEALLRRYDEIVVLKAGKVVETGAYEALMEKKEYFYSLYTISQA